MLENRFAAIDRDGPVKYAQFLAEPQGAATAFAVVQDFLKGIRINP